MYAIIGLGNPEKKYDKTRHNIGFDVIDELASQMGVQVNTKRHKAYSAARSGFFGVFFPLRYSLPS